jgi:hypothetical protein
VPVWHEGTAKWVKAGKLVLLGVTQEQHADRCRLLAQWKGFDWPILHDPINLLEPMAVPVLTAIDEHGIVRVTKPDLATFQAAFVDKAFADDAKDKPDRVGPSLKDGAGEFAALQARADKTGTVAAWRELGDALALWGGDKRLDQALAAYTAAVKKDPKDGPAWFRLGVCYRQRSETGQRQSGDFQAAVASWGQALDLDPNRYIWRRRIQQYGPRLDQPYSFYDWVAEAEKDLLARGETPVKLAVRPGAAEIAHPIKTFPTPKDVPNPDPHGKITRDKDGLVVAEVTVAPAKIRAGQSGQVHVALRLDPKQQAHWNNEAEPLRLWIEPPAGWTASAKLLTVALPREAVSTEERVVNFEVKAPKDAKGRVLLPVYALYHICDDRGGQCRFLRLDVMVEVNIAP